MPRYYDQIGDAVGDAMAHNARMAAQHAIARAAEDAARKPLCRCGHPENEHVTGPTALCIVCPDDEERTWRHPYTPQEQPR